MFTKSAVVHLSIASPVELESGAPLLRLMSACLSRWEYRSNSRSYLGLACCTCFKRNPMSFQN